MGPASVTQLEKAYWQKHLVTATKSLSKNIPVHQTIQPFPAQGLPGLEHFERVLALLKSTINEPEHVTSKVLACCVKEGLLRVALSWADACLPAHWVEAAASVSGGSHASVLGAALRAVQALLRLTTLMLRPYASPRTLAGTAAAQLASTALDVQPLANILLRLLRSATASVLSDAYRASLLGQALNLATTFTSLALHPALIPSTLHTTFLRAAVTTPLLPSLCTLLATARPCPAPGQSQEAWYEGAVGAVVGLIMITRPGPTSQDAEAAAGWHRSILSPAVQDLLLERLVHGLTEASPGGNERPPGFEALAFLRGRCCPPQAARTTPSQDEDTELLQLMQLCLDAQWLAWRAAQAHASLQRQQQTHLHKTHGSVGVQGGGLDPSQLFELTRQVAEQAAALHSTMLQDCQAAVEAWEAAVEEAELEGGLPPSTGPPADVPSDPAPLSVISTCLADLQWLYSHHLPWAHRSHQLPLVMALGANALAFSAQVLEAEKGQREVTPGQSHLDSARSNQAPDFGTRLQPAFGRNGISASINSPAAAAKVTIGKGTGLGLKQPATSRGLVAAECCTRAASLLSFLFPLEWSGEAEEARSYPPHAWPQVSSQAAGALGALDIALRSQVAPSPAVQVMLLHAVAGACLAAPGSFWVSGEANRTAQRLEVNVEEAEARTAQRLEVNVKEAEAAGQEVAAGPQYPEYYVPGGPAKPNPHREAAAKAAFAAEAAAVTADAISPELQREAGMMLQLVTLIMDSFIALTAPVREDDPAAVQVDPDFTGAPSPGRATTKRGSVLSASRNGVSNTSDAGRQQSTAIVVVLTPNVDTAVPGVRQSQVQLAPPPLAQGRRGRGEAHPLGALPAAAVPQRISTAKLQLRALVLAELGPAWLRLWLAQLSALVPPIQAAELARAAAQHAAARGRDPYPGLNNRQQQAELQRSAEGIAEAEAARYGLMRTGLEWAARVSEGVGAVTSGILQAYSAAVSAAASGPAGRQAPIDPALVAVTKAARDLASVLPALGLLPALLTEVQTERRRLGGLGVPEGQAGALRAMATTLAALAGLPAGGRPHLARAALEGGLADALGQLYDAQRRLGSRASASAATMDVLQVIASAVQQSVTRSKAGSSGGAGHVAGVAAGVEEVRRMLAAMSTAPPPGSQGDNEFEGEAGTLVEVLKTEALPDLKTIAGPCPSMDCVLAGMPLHVGCCNPGCTNLEEESELLLRLHLCQGCMRVRYCCRECQGAAWGTHAEQCRAWGKLVRPGSPSS